VSSAGVKAVYVYVIDEPAVQSRIVHQQLTNSNLRIYPVSWARACLTECYNFGWLFLPWRARWCVQLPVHVAHRHRTRSRTDAWLAVTNQVPTVGKLVPRPEHVSCSGQVTSLPTGGFWVSITAMHQSQAFALSGPLFVHIPSATALVCHSIDTHALVPNFGLSQLWTVDALAG
jgi:hypothetical protein